MEKNITVISTSFKEICLNPTVFKLALDPISYPPKTVIHFNEIDENTYTLTGRFATIIVIDNRRNWAQRLLKLASFATVKFITRPRLSSIGLS